MRVTGALAATVLAAFALLPSSARAGAFTLEPGETKFFATAQLTTGDEYFDRRGKTRPRGRYSKYDYQLYGEYGALDGLTMFGSSGFQKVKLKDGATFEREGLGRSELGARVRLFQRDDWIVSAQGSAIIAGAKDSGKLAVVGEADDQADFRGLVAHSFQAFGKPAFVDFGAGYRVRGGDPADEVRVDATFGVRPLDRLLLLAQSFNQVGTSRWSGPFALKQRIHKLQFGAIYDLTGNLSVIAAGLFSPFGRDTLNERGGTIGLGLRF